MGGYLSAHATLQVDGGRMSDSEAVKMLEDEMQFLRDRLARLGQLCAEIKKRIGEPILGNANKSEIGCAIGRKL